MKDTVELQEKISANESPTDDTGIETSLLVLRQCRTVNKELRPIIKGTLDLAYVDKYIKFSDSMDFVLTALEEVIKDFDAILTTRGKSYQPHDKDI